MSPFKAIALASAPAACMLLFTFVGLNISVPPNVAGALQHFAAGVLLCTIGTELLPAMQNASGWWENFSAAVGFFLGVAVLIVLGIVMPESDEEEGDDGSEEKEGKEETDRAVEMREKPKKHRRRISGRSSSLRNSALRYSDIVSAIEEDDEGDDEEGDRGVTMSGAGEDTALLGSKPSPSKGKPFPTAFVFAVVIDSVLDGFLIGIAVAAGPSAGPMMSASLSVEMGFLGLTLATALHGNPTRLSFPAAFCGPLAIMLGACVGGFMAATLGKDPALLAGMLSFGTSALLFMVAEELLLEAHEDGDHCWWADLQLYIGFFVSVMGGKVARL